MGRIRISALFLAFVLLLSGCGVKESSRQIFAMDTLMGLAAYGSKGEDALEQGVERIYEIESRLSVTRQDSEISAINQAGGEWTTVSQETFDLLERSLELCASTGGALDITAYTAVRAWGFTTGEYRVPSQEELAALAGAIDYTAVELDRENCRVRLPQGMSLDLGSVVKGWTGDELSRLLLQSGVESASLELGGNVQMVGSKPDGSAWRVGLQDPESETGVPMAVVTVEGLAVVTSGGYQRYFEQEGVRYWHIIDPATAAPARSGVLSATIVGAEGLVCDALSTALFVMGADRAAQYWRTHQEMEFEYILVLEDGSVQITQGLESSFALANGYQDREVAVIAP